LREKKIRKRIKVSNDYRKFIDKLNGYLRKTKENAKRYYQDLLSKELDLMESAVCSGNILQAASYKITANVYESIIQNL
jgi:hypothetical protein